MSAGLKLKEQATKAWKDLHQSTRIQTDLSGSDPLDVWLVSTPKSVAVQPLIYTQTSIQTGLAIRADVKAMISKVEVARPAISKVPVLNIMKELPAEFEIRIPVIASLNDLNSSLVQQLVKKPIKLKDNGELKIHDAKVLGHDGELLLDANVCYEVSGVKVEGHVYFAAKPKFDTINQTLSINDFHHTIETKGVLSNIANGLLEPYINDALVKKLRYDASKDCAGRYCKSFERK